MVEIEEIQKQIRTASQTKEKEEDKKHRFNITGNVAKDFIKDEIKKHGKDIDPNEVTRKMNEYLGDKESESLHFRFYKIPENDRLKNYQLLIKHLNFLINDSKEDTGIWEGIIKPIMENAKVFEIEDELVPILSDTDSRPTRLPYGQIALDVRIPIGDRIYYGILISNHVDADDGNYGVMELSKEEEHKNYIVIYACYTKIVEESGEREMFFEIITIGKEGEEKLDKYKKKIEKFVYSFCNFINEPDVEISETILNEKNNIRRKQRGSLPLPSNSKITIYGHLRKYISDYNEGLRGGYSHKFRVRGHYKHFRDQTRYVNIYKLKEKFLAERGYQKSDGIIKKWIRPYLKGEGILIEKTYKLKK